MKSNTVDVIIPVYKTAAYLRECVDSVLSQTYKDIRIILVDDGSPDECPAICDSLAKGHNNIIVLHCENAGSGVARNTGMDNSDGEYIMFLDSDDRLDEEGAIESLVKKALSTSADIVAGCYRRFDENYISGVNYHHLHPGHYTKTVDFRFRGFYKYGHLAYNWGKLYRRSFLEKNNLRSKSYPFTQDKAYNMEILACEPKYAFIRNSIVMYRVNENSVTFRYKPKYTEVWLEIAGGFTDFLKERGMAGKYGDLTALHIFYGSFFLVKQELEAKKGLFSAAGALREYGSKPIVKKNFRKLAKGRYLKRIYDRRWRFVIRAASILFSMKLYLPFATGIALLRKAGIDTGITRSRYR